MDVEEAANELHHRVVLVLPQRLALVLVRLPVLSLVFLRHYGQVGPSQTNRRQECLLESPYSAARFSERAIGTAISRTDIPWSSMPSFCSKSNVEAVKYLSLWAREKREMVRKANSSSVVCFVSIFDFAPLSFFLSSCSFFFVFILRSKLWMDVLCDVYDACV